MSANEQLTSSATGPYKVCAQNIYGIWRYTYGIGCSALGVNGKRPYTYHDLILPAQSEVDLTVARSTIARTVRISGLGLTLRAQPRAAVETRFYTRRAGGVYPGVCLQACSLDRKFASAEVTVVTPRRYESWLGSQVAAIANQDKQRSALHTQLIQQGVLAPKSTA